MIRHLPLLALICAVLAWPSYCAWKSYRYHTIPPSFDAQASRVSKNLVLLNIEPNFVVRRVYKTSVSHKSRVLFKESKVVDGGFVVNINEDIPVGANLTVECDLQYDRLVPSLISLSKTVVVK